MFEATLRYNSNSAKPTISTSENYLDSLLIPGRMLAYSEKALPQDLRKYADEHHIDYYIEPTLPDFRVGDDFRDENGIRGWHNKYVESLTPSLRDLLNMRENVDASELSKSEVEAITKSAVEFQENYVVEQLEDQAGKYEPLDDPEAYRPKAVIPWFHKIRSSQDIQVNDTILTAASETATLPLKPCLFVTKAFLRQDGHQTKLVELLAPHDIEQCFIWIEDLDKQGTKESDYVEAAKLVTELVDEGIAPHFFYGDYFATVLFHLGLEGTTYGTMYGEDAVEKRETRSGDGMLSRYYLREIKDFVKIPAAVDLQKRVDADMCECDVCQRQFDDWQDLADREQGDENIQTPVKKHHLRVRWEQSRVVEQQSLDETLNALEDAYQEYTLPFNASNQVSSKKTLNYLPRWVHAVRTIRR